MTVSQTDMTLLDEVAQLRADLAEAQHKIDNLYYALDTSRRIGAAVGILMAQRHLTEQDAFELLCAASQRRHVKLRQLAEEVTAAGTLSES